MTCDEVKERLWAYLEQETTAEETTEIEAHLVHCVACREELALQREIKQALASLPDEELPATYHAELMQKLQAENRRKPFYRRRQLGLIAAAALVLVAAGGTNGLLAMREQQNAVIEQTMFGTTQAAEDEAEDIVLSADVPEKKTAETDALDTETTKIRAEDKANLPLRAANPEQTEGVTKQTTEQTTEKTTEKITEKTTEQVIENTTENLVFSSGAQRSAAQEDSLTLLVKEKTTALEAIRAAIEKYGGTEEEITDGAIQAVISALYYSDFLAEIGTLGEVRELSQAEEDGAPHTICISVVTEASGGEVQDE